MKKVVSLVLATLMVVSLFAVNAYAMIDFTYTEMVGAQDEIVMVGQDFSNSEKTDFTYSADGNSDTTVEDGCVTISPKAYYTDMNVSTDTPVTAEKWTIEFDVRRNSDFINTEYYGLFFGCQKAAYKDNVEKKAASLHKYGLYVPLMDKEKDTWYTYRFTFDETLTDGTWWGTVTTVITSAEFKKAGDTGWTKIDVGSGNWNSTGTKSKAVAGDNSGNYVAGSGELSFMFRSLTGNKDPEEIANASFSLDNIKAYVPGIAGEEVVKNCSLTNGTIYLSSEIVNLPDASKYSTAEGGVINTNVQYTETMPAAVEGSPCTYALTFDARNSVQGLPLLLHIGGNAAKAGLVICPTDIIGTEWKSYKLILTETAGNDYLNIVAYMKPYGSDADYVNVPVATKYKYESGDAFWTYGSRSGAKQTIRPMYDIEVEAASYPGADPDATVWELKNLQLTSEAVVAGLVNAVDGVITVDADFKAAASNTLVALAVKDGGRMVDVDFVNVADGEGDIDLTASYEDGNTANLFIWKAGTNAPLVQPINVISALAK